MSAPAEPPVDPALVQRLSHSAVDNHSERQRRKQWDDVEWAARQVADGTFRTLALIDAVEIALRDDEFAVRLLDVLKALRKGKRGGVTLPKHVHELVADWVDLYRDQWAKERAALVTRRTEISKPLYPSRAADKAQIKAENVVREAELLEIDKQIAYIDSHDPVDVVAAKLGKKGGGKLAGSTLKRRRVPSAGRR